MPFKHVLVATDFSDNAKPAIDLAVEVARGSNAALTLVHVADVSAYAYSGMAMTAVDLITPVLEAAHEALDRALVELRKRVPEAKAILRQGITADEVVAAVGSVGADLVVIGTHGRTGMRHLVLGSVAEKVVRLSPVPVLTVRSRGD